MADQQKEHVLKTVRVPAEFEAIFAKAEEAVSSYFQNRKDDPEHGTIEIFGERYILVRAASLSVEFFEQVEQLFGPGREADADQFARNFLFDLAHALSKSDARNFHRKMNLVDPIAKLSAGPIHFAHSGWAFVDISKESRPVPNDDYYLLFDHPYSSESDAWLRAGRSSKFPVCIMNAGWSSGWCEESFGVQLVASEILCKAKGDKTCRFIMAPPKRIEEHVRRYLGEMADVEIDKFEYEIPDFFARKRSEEELKILYERLRELDKLKSQFFANVSHELRTPLSLILGLAERTLNSLSITDGHRRNLELILRNARILLKTVNDLLDVSKLEAGKLTPAYAEVDLAELTRLTCSLFESIVQERKISFLQEIPRTLTVQIDREMAQRVLLNLLSNAFKFVSNGGQVVCRLSSKNEYAILEVQDNGPGVPKQMRKAIFERFRQVEGGPTRKFGGTGLGLAIAKEFVELHQGKIAEEDAPGGGALFIASFPLKAPAGTAVENTSPGLADEGRALSDLEQLRKSASGTEPLIFSKGGENGVVLIVEDNLEMNHFIAQALAHEFDVIAAFDGKDGLDKAIQHKPDLILSDIMMPVMTGDELVLKVRARSDFEGTPIIILTAKADEELKLDLLRNGAQDYLMKPFSAEELCGRVRNLVSMKRAREVLQREVASKRLDLEALANEVTLRRIELQRSLEEEKAAKAEAERLLHLRDEFLSIASHELRTPLTPLKLLFQLMKRMIRGGIRDEKVFDNNIDIAERQIERLSKLIENLLDVSRMNFGRLYLTLEDVDLSEVIHGVLDRFKTELEAAHCPVELHLESDVKGHWDRLRIEQIVTNLISNAIKYGQGKPIWISAMCHENIAKFVVQDFGIGIAKSEQGRIFNRFERAASAQQFAGMGLGLYIVRQIILAHAGTISVKSEPGEGSTFIVELPCFTPANHSV